MNIAFNIYTWKTVKHYLCFTRCNLNYNLSNFYLSLIKKKTYIGINILVKWHLFQLSSIKVNRLPVYMYMLIEYAQSFTISLVFFLFFLFQNHVQDTEYQPNILGYLFNKVCSLWSVSQ